MAATAAMTRRADGRRRRAGGGEFFPLPQAVETHTDELARLDARARQDSLAESRASAVQRGVGDIEFACASRSQPS